MTRAPSLATTLLAALVISGCGTGTATTSSTSTQPAAGYPATTTTPKAKHEPATEKARSQKVLQEVIAGCTACRKHSSGPPTKPPAKEREAVKKANEQRRAEATKQAQRIEEYKAAERATEEQSQP